ncbi:MAG: hypothetical protein KBS74_01040 [Clostridiales bacterium]|nr:hypothetical protein [Candidatus Cacconaster stercorequi]
MKKTISILLALVLILSLSVTAFADENYQDVSEVTITKNYIITGGQSPAETFKFTIEAVSVTDAKEGVTKDNMPMPTIPADTVAFVKLTANNSKTFNVTLPDYADSGVGIYTYKITETAGNTAGVTYNETPLFLKITVIEQDGKLVRVAAVRKGTAEGTKTNVVDNEYDPGTLAIKKTVTGKLGDKTKFFKFTVTLTGEEGKTYYPELFTVSGGSYTSNPKTGELQMGANVFYLKHGETVTIGNLPAGTSYTVAEEKYTDYTTSKNGDTGTITKDGATAEFVNDKGTIVDTGISLDSAPFIALFAVAALGMFVLLGKKRFN